jgi:hypothetical protein
MSMTREIWRPGARKRPGRTGRRANGLAATAFVFALGAAHVGPVPVGSPVASTGAAVWKVSRSPKLRVNVAAGCPPVLGRYQDVVNTFPGPPLVPSDPRAGIICRYGPSATKPGVARLERQTRLSSARAAVLTTAVRRLSLAPPAGVMHCPADFGVVTVIGLSFSGRPDVGLWYQATGCQTLDNGRIGSFEGGNPSFSNGFLTTIDHLSPPVRP